MNKKEINKLARQYASLLEGEKKLFLKNEKKRIESLSTTENKVELNAIKDIVKDLKKDIKAFQSESWL
jgi:hypothetical protein